MVSKEWAIFGEKHSIEIIIKHNRLNIELLIAPILRSINSKFYQLSVDNRHAA